MKIEGSDSIEQAEFVQVLVHRKWHDPHTVFADRRAQPELIYNRYAESLHNRTRVLPKTLLAWGEFVAMVADESIGTVKSSSWKIKSCQLPGMVSSMV